MSWYIKWILWVCLFIFSPVSMAKLPSGDYLRSCINCRVVNNTLSCWCYASKKTPIYSSFKGASLCPHFVNHNGHLACGVQAKYLPHGQYKKSCRRCSFDGRNLQCQCRTNNKSAWLPTTLLDSKRCTGNIYNDNGVLSCAQRKQAHRDVPIGSYLATCTRCTYEKKSILGCFCKSPESRRPIYSRLFHPKRCQDIENIGGRLTCING